jgi:hypothetical protein
MKSGQNVGTFVSTPTCIKTSQMKFHWNNNKSKKAQNHVELLENKNRFWHFSRKINHSC